MKLKCCFTSTETIGLILRTRTQDGHLDFHTPLKIPVAVNVLDCGCTALGMPESREMTEVTDQRGQINHH